MADVVPPEATSLATTVGEQPPVPTTTTEGNSADNNDTTTTTTGTNDAGAPLAGPGALNNDLKWSKDELTEFHKLKQLPKLVDRFRSLIALADYDPKTMWDDAAAEVAKEFFDGDSSKKLFLYMDSGKLVVSPQLPPSAVAIKLNEIQYFIRGVDAENDQLTLQTFERKVQYGTISGVNLDSLLRTMQGVYVPMFLENNSWPDSVRKDFSNQLHRFMAFLTDTTYQLKGHTVLYVPPEDLSDVSASAKSKDIVQRLESLLVHWTRQIKDVINNQHTSESAEASGPLQEIEFWKSRCEDLSGISEQLNRPEVKAITNVLEVAKSNYLEQFVRLSQLIQEGTVQATDNLKFLSSLAEPCAELATAEPKNIPAILPKILHRIRLIWANSKYYNTKERLTELLRKVSNEIISRCCAKISLDDVFKGDVFASIDSLQDSAKCGETWKQTYKKFCTHVSKFSSEKGTWDFDQSSIFAQMDAFVQRCRDLLEVCEGQIQFARKSPGGSRTPVPIFGGSKGPEIAKGLEDVEHGFDKLVSNLWNIRKYILDVKATQWHDNYTIFKKGVKDLEVMMQNIISSAFENVGTIEGQLELLEIFHHLAKKEAIKRTVERKAGDLWKLFLHELNVIKTEFETHRKTPDILRWHPDYSGSGFWARTLLRRINVAWKAINDAYWKPVLPIAEEAKHQYEALVSSLDEYISRTHDDWAGLIPREVGDRLNMALMLRGSNNHLETKFDKDLIRLFQEATYWQKLKSDIPSHAQELYNKREELRVLRENVLLVVRDYNNILDTLSADELLLFRERIKFLDRKLNPGLSNLTWASKGITEFFVKETRRHCHEVRHIVSEFGGANSTIRDNCKAISETMLWYKESKAIYDLSEFEAVQENHHAQVRRSLLTAFENIKSTLVKQYEVFKEDGKEVQTQWVRYTEKIDKMIEESLRTAVKKSLQDISKAINGDVKNRDSPTEIPPLFKVNVVLEQQKVDFAPTLQKLEETVNAIAREMISIIKVVPRLSNSVDSSNKPSFYEAISGEDDILKIFVSIQNGMSNNAQKCQAYLRNWDSYREIWEINKDAFIRRYAKLKPALSTFDADINRYNEVANNTQKEETLTNINFVRLDCSPLKHALVSHCHAWQNKLTTLLNTNAANDLKALHTMFKEKSERLSAPPTSLDLLSESLNLMTQVQGDMTSIEAQFRPIHEQYQILEKYEVQILDDEKVMLETLHPTWVAFQQTITDSDKMLQDSKVKFKQDLVTSLEEFSTHATAMRDEFLNKGPFQASFGIDKALQTLTEYKDQIQKAAGQEREIRKGLQLFKIEQAPQKNIELMGSDLELLTQIWTLAHEWNAQWETWKTQPFSALNMQEMEEVVQRFIKKVTKLGRDMKDWEVYQNVKDKINQVKRTIPVLSDLRNPALRERHWNQLMEEIQKTFDPMGPEFTLEKVLEYGLDQYAEIISNMSGAASKELSIEQGLSSIKDSWNVLELDIVGYKEDRGYFKLRSTDPIFELLEDNQVTLSSMKASKFSVAFEQQIDYWERTLSHIIESIELVLQVQRQWMYLENIFVGTEDIRKQLPKESVVFDTVNTAWKTIMTKMVSDKNVLRATHQPNLLEILNEMNTKLERIQKSLDMYLETKRQAFPRFYFLSNDDLLEILGQAKDPNAVQPHLKKCFDGIHKLELIIGSPETRRHSEATGMYASDGEFVPFHAPVVIEGPVESWLTDVETNMRVSLKKLLVGTLGALTKAKKDKWIKEWPGQLLISAGLIQWTQDCTKALMEAEKGDEGSLKELKKKQMFNLKKLADLVMTPLSKIERKKLIALITVEVHSRDVIDRMYKAECSSVNAFEWVSQLRFYWDKDEDDCVIRQINTHFIYGYEYLGNSGRLVITPLTDRCYMTLTTALHLYRGGSPQGPAGTGKTETVKDLGKALGKYVIVQNCSEALDYKSIGRMFSGLCQTGAWGCFDEFNRIDIEVLSVVALQVSSIFSAVARKAKTFIFEGKEIRIDSTLGIFITMNPGYAGRTELPDNLKSLFRPVAMVTPDTTMIAEIMLFSEGFSNTKVLSKKVDTLYKLAAQQLSKQDHYDFGLRALTSALRFAGSRKRMDLTVPDEVVLYMTMRDNNTPKLTAEDVPLFMGILSDLFPGVEAIPVDYTEFKNAVIEEMKVANLQPVESMITKVIQLYETKQARHGVMIVGEAGSGKSSVSKLLQNSLTRLAKAIPDKYVGVKTFVINPKALNLAELYGEFNINTNEWTDGILSSVMRTACSDEKKDQKWVVLDGPVDTLWIESMNTVLDDNKILTLINGERIALPEQVSLLFEVRDLMTASPATVSRCGMIYMDYQDLGWKPFIESWLAARSEKQGEEIIRRLIDKYFEKTLNFRRSACKELVPVQEISSVRSFCNLFDAVAIVENGVDPNDAESYPKMVELWFLFSIIWSFGGALVDDSRKKFDMFLREIEGQFPSKDTVYEYVVDKQNKGWASWEDKLPNSWKYHPQTSFYKIFVPTVDTIRNEFILRSLIEKKVPLLMVGDVGTGKTSLIQSTLSSLDDPTKSTVTINLSAQTSSNALQSIFESKVEKRTKNVYVPLGGKQLVAFIDDLNMPMKDTFGAQPPLEFLRHWMDYGFCYDRQKQLVKYINDILVVGAMGPPGGGRNPMCPRIQSRFHVINYTFPGEKSINRIFGSIINQKLQDFEEEVKPLGDIMTHATLEIYNTIVSQLLPTPAKIHYLFNLRDISKVFQGLLRASKEYYDTRDSLIKLWVHEVHRVFQDRLINKEDRDFFQKLVDDKLSAQFSTSLKQLIPDKRVPIFCDFMKDNGDNYLYEEVPDMAKLKTFVEEKLQDYNVEPGFIQLDLVLFRDAIEHICRITRILRLQNGNVLLVGVGGSGRQSLTRLAAYVVGLNVFQIKIAKNYRLIEFREDLKKVYRMAGVDNKPTVFLFTDAQIINNSFLEDVCNILSSGEVPNMYTKDEITEIRQAILANGKPDRVADNDEAMYQFFLERVRSNLHVVLAMSPVGNAFRNRLRMFPAIVNCTTIDWFSEWPEDALQEVAIKYLEPVELGSAQLKKAVSQVFVSAHLSVVEQSAKMAFELKRYNYVTPINYLELVTGYRELLKEKKKEIGELAWKLKNGLSKLDDTRQYVEKISVELEVAKKQVAQFQKQCEDYLVVIVQQKREADEQAKTVAARTEKLLVEEELVRKEADEAQADLDLAMPALEAATKALEAINKKDLQEIKSYGKPPPLVEKVLEGVMILKKAEPTWEEAKRQLGNPMFIKQLVNFDRDNISDKILKRISQYCADENFQPDIVGRVSGAAKSLCMWVRAMETYGMIFRQVAPKKEKLRNAQETLEKKQRTLKEAKAKLEEIQVKLNELQTQYDEKLTLKEKLRKDSEDMELKLNRAEKLVSGLSGERSRWENSIKNYEAAIGYLPGDCLIAAAFLSYAGPFNSTYRQRLIQNVWLPQMKTLEIPFSPEFAFETFLGKPTEIREWNLQGLPSDAFSSENGIIVTRGRRWPLMIDPQGQANKWIRKMEASRDLKIIDLKQADFLRTLENAIQFGVPVLLQGLLDVIDPALDPILNKAIVKKAGRYIIKLGDKEVEYNPEFKFYLTTKLPNPHYAPEIFAKAAIVNFAVKEKGLEDQLLGIVVRREKPELEEQKSTLVISVAKAKKKLAELEDEILRLLSTAQGSLLDDEKLVNTLQSSKAISEEVTQQLVVSEQTEKRIDVAREGYRPCAQRASILYFVLNDLATIDPMYQFSLESYVDLFEKSIAKSKKFDNLQERLMSLNDYHTYAVYKNTCRGLFEQHKLLFSFQIAIKILEAANKINKEEYDFFLRGGIVLDKEAQLPNPYSEWIDEPRWDNVTELDKMQAFAGFISSMEQNEKDWKNWFTSGEPEELAIPGDWDNKLNDLQRMLIIRSLRPDRVIFCAQKFVLTNLGQKFIEPPILDVNDILSDSAPKTPLIFVLSPGVDPTATLQALAQKQNMANRFQHISLGQGQAPKATAMVQEGIRHGHWVFLANCHLSISWMPSLDKMIENIATENPHPDFRLWLSSSPHPQFPISILQSGIKMTTEPPKGLKANLSRLYNKTVETAFAKCTKPEVFKKLFFSLCFFHSVLLERKKFLTLGWNVVTDFNDSDFDVCDNLIGLLLDEYQQIPWDALKYLIAEANYGGRVTDDFDRRVLRSYINSYFCDTAITAPQYRLSSMQTYYIPDDGPLQSYRDYIASLPNFDKPEVFGQHPNADIASQIKESNNLLGILTSLQPQISVGNGPSREDKVLSLIADISKRVPEDLDYENTYKLVKHDMNNPLNVVLLQEMQRYNVLLQSIRKSLSELEDGIKGIVLMSPELEEMFQFMYEGKVPKLWSKAYYSLKPLGNWVRDLIQRIEFFNEWSKGNEPKLYWLGAFTFPTGFLTAVLQKAARKNNVPVDVLGWEFTVLQVEDENHISEAPKEGVYIKNIVLEGASWDRKGNCLKEPKPMELLTPIPPIHFRPVETKKKSMKGIYTCPLYYYPIRTGSRERPSLVISVELKSGGQEADFWIKRGTAAFATTGL